MKTFDVYESPLGDRQVIKKGWSWPAFFVPIVWLAAKRMWTLFFVLMVLIMIALSIQGEHSAGLGPLIVGIIFGIKGNCWLANSLKRRGYQLKKTVMAHTREGALAAYIQPVQ